MPLQTINDIELYYEQHGAGDDLVLIGGLTSDHLVWKSALRVLSQHFRVLIFDNRGAGRSSTPDYPYTTEMMAHDTLSLMDALQISRAHVLGHSMGGCIAQQMAILAPDRINRMVIACSRTKMSTIANMIFSMRLKLQENGMKNDVLAEYVLPFLFSEHFLRNTAHITGFIQWTLHNPFQQSMTGFKQQLQAVKTHDITEKISRIETPTLVIAGEDDLLMPAKNGESFAKSLKNGDFAVMPQCGHLPHVEYPKEFAELVLGFINR